jgi:thiol-disulfide isomerase/thioredoxin
MEDSPEPNQPKKGKGNWKILGIIVATIGIVILIYIFTVGLGSTARDDDVSLSQIKTETNDNTIVLYFWSNSCVYCEQQKPIIKDLESEYKAENVTFYWLDVNNHDKISDEYDVYGVPVTIVLNQYGVVKKFTGYTDQDRIENAINDAISSYS